MVLMRSKYEYRAATLGDLDSLVIMWCESARYHEGIETRFQYTSDANEWTAKYFTKQLPLDSFCIFIACDGDTDIGYIETQVTEKQPIHAHRKVGYIGSIYVKSQYRRKRVGVHLWDLARDWLLTHEVAKIQLSVAAMNPDAIKFWMKL